MSVKKAKEIILNHLDESTNGIILLNTIYPVCVQNQIKDDEVESALKELEKENKIKIEDLRKGMFWQLKVVKML